MIPAEEKAEAVAAEVRKATASAWLAAKQLPTFEEAVTLYHQMLLKSLYAAIWSKQQ